MNKRTARLKVLGRFRQWNQIRKTRRVVERYLEQNPAPRPSEISAKVQSLPKSVKREHKLEVRRGYRSRKFKGITSSVQRQIMAEQVAGPLYADAERQARYAREDQEYGAAIDR